MKGKIIINGDLFNYTYDNKKFILDNEQLIFDNKISPEKFITVVHGSDHVVAVDDDGYLWGIGLNTVGQLGLGDKKEISIMTKISSHKFMTVSCGMNHTAAIDTNGYLWTCGSNEYRKLCFDYDIKEIRNMTMVTNEIKFISVKCGWSHTVALDEEGYMWGAGCGTGGQLGIIDNCKLVQLMPLSTYKFSAIDCGFFHTAAIDVNGYLWYSGVYKTGDFTARDLENKDNFTQISEEKFCMVNCSVFSTGVIDEKGCLWFRDGITELNKISSQIFTALSFNYGRLVLLDEEKYLWIQSDKKEMTLTKINDVKADILSNSSVKKRGLNTKSARKH